MPDMFSANGNQLKVDMGGQYDAGITEEIDRKIRHLPIVEKYANDMARLLKISAGTNFEVVQGGGPSRVRVYVTPKNNQGIHEELSQAVLLKAALGMSGR